MGVRLVRGLVEAGWRVRALVLPGDRKARSLGPTACEVREGDITAADTMRGLCDDVDTVYHLAAVTVSRDPSAFGRVNRAGTSHVVDEAVRAGVRHFIYVSSASVTYAKRTLYAQSKLDAEEVVKSATSMAYTIVRPTLVYDTGGGPELLMYLDYLGRFPVVPFIGIGRARKRPVWASDVVDGLLRLAGNPIAHDRTYNFSGPDTVTIAQLGRKLLAVHGRRRLFVPIPVALCRALAHVLARLVRRPPLTPSAIDAIVNDADLDPSLAIRELGYRPLSLDDGLRRCFAIKSLERQHPTALDPKPEGHQP
jgi:NADH dehydrogenase